MERKTLKSLNIDFANFDEVDSQGKFVFDWPNVLSFRRKKEYIPRWNAEDLRDVEDTLSIYRDVPLMCKGEECEFAADCPLVKAKKVGRWIGNGCPLEYISAFRHFAGYVNDLEINPEDFVDIKYIDDLVRIQIQMERCDKLIRLEAPLETMVSGTDKQSGLQHKARQQNQLIAQQRNLRQDQRALYKDLVASRGSKVDAESKVKTKADASTSMAEMLQEYLNRKDEGNRFQKLETYGD